MNAELMTTIEPWFTGDGGLLPFEAREQGTPNIVTINTRTIAYIARGSWEGATYIHFIGGDSIEIVCRYEDLSSALRGCGHWIG